MINLDEKAKDYEMEVSSDSLQLEAEHLESIRPSIDGLVEAGNGYVLLRNIFILQNVLILFVLLWTYIVWKSTNAIPTSNVISALITLLGAGMSQPIVAKRRVQYKAIVNIKRTFDALVRLNAETREMVDQFDAVPKEERQAIIEANAEPFALKAIELFMTRQQYVRYIKEANDIR